MKPRLALSPTEPSTRAGQRNRRPRRERRKERLLLSQLAARPRHVRDELLEMASRVT
jgi:hypothetical protein